MQVKQKMILVNLMVFLLSFSPLFAIAQESADDKKLEMIEAVVMSIEATVESIDYDTREVSLKGPKGNVITIEVDERVKNLPQVAVGDTVTVDYVEAVTIQVFSKEELEAGTVALAVEGSAEPGEKPAGVSVEEMTVITTISAIDKEQQLVTLEDENGKTKTVKARNPENLEKVTVGDKVMISYTTALGISVAKK